MAPVKSLIASASLFAAAYAQSSSEAQNKGNITCPTGDGVHIIVSRGSLESQDNGGEGLTGTLASNISAKIPGSTSQGLVYPAVLFPYFDSENQGIGNLTQLLVDFNAACPSSKYVLLGWSQGGQTTFDTLCGNSEIGFPQTQPIASQYTENLVAAVSYGDPSFQVGQPWDAGTYNTSQDGIFNRTNPAGCEPYASKMRSYCDYHDTYCQNYNSSGLYIHFGYFEKYNTEAADFVVSQYSSAMSATTSATMASSTAGGVVVASTTSMASVTVVPTTTATTGAAAVSSSSGMPASSASTAAAPSATTGAASALNINSDARLLSVGMLGFLLIGGNAL